MNKKGFTLIELLAVVVILGIVGSVAVYFISKTVFNSRVKSYITLSITYANAARKIRAEDRLPIKMKDGDAILYRAKSLDVSDNGFNSPFAKLDEDKSYVIIYYKNNEYRYLVTLMDKEDNGFIVEDVRNINEDSIKIGEGTDGLVTISAMVVGNIVKLNNIDFTVKTVRDKYIILSS